MESSEDKAKKLKEIQERLAEIQTKSGKKPNPPASDTSIPKPTPTPSTPPQPKAPEVKTEEAPAQQEQKTIPPVEQPWAGNKPKTEKPEAKPSPEKKPKKEASKPTKPKSGKPSKKLVPIISFVITLIVVGYFGYTYFLEQPASEPIHQDTAAEAAQTNATSDESTLQPTPQEVMDEETHEAPSLSEQTAEAKKPASPAPAPKSQTTSSHKVPSGFIISFASNSSPDVAASNVAMLKKQGFKADYYFMPDQKKGNPSLYKVYVGPYNSESAAFPDFKKVIQLNDKAFILNMAAQ